MARPDCLEGNSSLECHPGDSVLETNHTPYNFTPSVWNILGNVSSGCVSANGTSGCFYGNFSTSESPPDDIITRLNDAEVRRQIPLIIFLTLISVVGIPGNALVCYIYRSRYSLSSSRWFIFFLASVDIFSCVIVVPCEIATSFLQYNFKNLFTCKLTAFMNLWMLLCLGLTLVLIAVDRYRKVCRPLGWQINIKRAKILCCGAILFSLGVSVPATIMYRIHSFPLGAYSVMAHECSLEGSQRWAVYYVMFGMSLFVSALTTICVLYCLIGCQIKKHVYQSHPARRTHSSGSLARFMTTRIVNPDLQSTDMSQELSPTDADFPTNTSAKEMFDDEKPQQTPFKSLHDKRESKRLRQSRARRATFIMFLISIVFVISYLPFLTLLLYRSIQANAFSSLSDTGRTVYKFFLRSYFVSCAVNPMIYGISDPKFRSNCKEVLRKFARFFACSTYTVSN